VWNDTNNINNDSFGNNWGVLFEEW